MITVCLLIVVLGTAAVCLTAAMWDTVEPVVLRFRRKVRRGLCARWLAEDGLTVRPLHEEVAEPETVHAMSAEELIKLIKEY